MKHLQKSIRFFTSKEQKQAQARALSKMADKLQALRNTLSQTSPRVFSFFMILTTLPTFYFGYQVLINQYSDKKFSEATDKCIKYFYFKNIGLYSCCLALSGLNFLNPSSSYTVYKKTHKRLAIPLFLSLIGLMMPPCDNKYIALPPLFVDIYTLLFEAKLCNQGTIPMWFYSYRHYIRFFDIFVILMVFVALKRYQNRVSTHPYEFIQDQQTDQSTKSDIQAIKI